MAELRKATIHGYADRLSVAPGEPIEFKVSCEEPGDYRVDIVRLIHGDANPAGPGYQEQVLETQVSGLHRGRYQPIDVGSCVVVRDDGALALTARLTLHAFVMPTTPGKAGQAVLGRFDLASGTGYALVIEDGAPGVLLGNGNLVRVSTGIPLQAWCWYSIAVTIEPGLVRLYCEPVVNAANSLLSPAMPISGAARSTHQIDVTPGDARSPLTIAGLTRQAGRPEVDAHFNGKIDRPKVWSRVLSTAELDAITAGEAPPLEGLEASWDFAAGITRDGIPTDRVVDIGPRRLHGDCVNFPARAMTGWNWEGREECFTHAPEQYGAIHFHDDDLEDCRWETDFAWKVPDDLRSGVYALRLTLGESEDHVPFFVLPPRGRATAKALLLLPTASYLAYANEHIAEDVIVAQSIFGRTAVLAEQDAYMYAHNDLGLSTYDIHADGSGVHYSSALRPIINLRPKYRHGIGGSWQFPADLDLVYWLETMGFDYDVATDRELHDEGAALLSRYKVVLTGTHPEYYSRQMLDAWEQYLARGGRAMYLGGNGFYWVANWHPDKPHLIEVRKGELGTRAWQAKPGEYYLQTNGERSGLWRARARAPQKLFGVGFTAEGFDHSSYYVQMPDARDPAVAFIMEGIGPDERIGDSGLAGGGAAGYELDRYDLALGTPPHARLLAYSQGHSDNYTHAVEEIFFNFPHVGGTMQFLVRADIVYFATRNGGGVFSTGSITWSGSLPHNGCDNNVSRMTGNVLRRFLGDEPLA